MSLQKLTKCFIFDSQIRPSLTFSDPAKIRLDSKKGQIELSQQGYERATGLPKYSTDADLYVQIAATNPQALRQWLGFQATPHPSKQPEGTSVGFKLNDGSDTYYWAGAAWAIAGVSDWNSEEEIAANIETFPATTKTLSILINLATTDELATPFISALDVLMLCDLSYIRSIVSESLIPNLREQIRPLVDFGLRAEGGDKVSLRDVETFFNILEVVEVHDHAGDPNHTTNLFSSYDVQGRVITLSSAVPQGTKLFIRFIAEPEVYLNWASQDYVEVEKIPAIVLDSFGISGNEVFGRQSVINRSNNTSVVRRSPLRLHLEFNVLLLAESNRVLMEMQDEALKYIANNPLLTWRALDEKLTTKMIEEPSLNPRPNLSDKHQAGYTLRIEDIFLWLKPEEALPLIQQFVLTFVTPEQQGGPRWTGAR